MFCKRLVVGLAVIAMGIAFTSQVEGVAVVDSGNIHVVGVGTGTFFPGVGSYVADGEVDTLGKCVATGRVETEQTGPTTLTFQDWGSGTRNEFLTRFLVADGTLFLRFDPGTVELTPVLDDPNFDPLVGPYTAQWETVERVVGGTGRFKNARGAINITATNLPFLLTDTEWPFTWTWDGEIRTRRGHDGGGDDD
jgi:hypothetical protein